MAHPIPEDGRIEPFKGLFLARSSAPMQPVYGVVEPSFCVIAQGSKEMRLGEKRYRYDPDNYLLTCLELPVALQVLEASKERPYLGLRLNLDPTLVCSILVEMNQLPQKHKDAQAIDVSPMNATLLDAVVRLVRLLDSPKEARLLLPLIKREVIYRLLVGEQGDRLRRMTLLGGHTHRIAQAVNKICREFSQPLRVGYDDASHFNREYKRLFGEPPMRDVSRLREAAFGDC